MTTRRWRRRRRRRATSIFSVRREVGCCIIIHCHLHSFHHSRNGSSLVLFYFRQLNFFLLFNVNMKFPIIERGIIPPQNSWTHRLTRTPQNSRVEFCEKLIALARITKKTIFPRNLFHRNHRNISIFLNFILHFFRWNIKFCLLQKFCVRENKIHSFLQKCVRKNKIHSFLQKYCIRKNKIFFLTKIFIYVKKIFPSYRKIEFLFNLNFYLNKLKSIEFSNINFFLKEIEIVIIISKLEQKIYFTFVLIS